MAEPVLSVAGLGKDYAEPVLSGVDLSLHAGEVLALTGENGAGKSTLSKIVGGLIPPTAGTMIYRGESYSPAGRREAEALGVHMVLQELNLLPTLTVAENLFLGRLPNRAGWIAGGKLRDAARAAMERVGLAAIHPDTLVHRLGIGHRQMVEIARGLIGECRVLILDEPTATLTDREADVLFDQIARLKKDGVAILYISHRLEELARIADRVAVLRDGRLIDVSPINSMPSNRIVSLMVGRELGEELNLGARKIERPLLKVHGLGRGDAVRDVSFEVRGGEIFGIFGLVGAGRTELLRLIYGADRADCGAVSIGDPPARVKIRSPADAVEHHMVMVTEDRQGEGLLLSQSIAANLALGNMASIARRGLVDSRRENALAERQIATLGIRASGPAQPVGELSGGNQQKIVIGRWLERDFAVFLFDEPTRGIDVAGKFDIYALFGDLARRGKALLVVSSDLRELMLISDRIAVMSAGRLVETCTRAAWSRDRLLAAAFAGQ